MPPVDPQVVAEAAEHHGPQPKDRREDGAQELQEKNEAMPLAIAFNRE